MTEQYEYQVINITNEPPLEDNPHRKPNIETAANRWAAMGWRTVAVMRTSVPGYADAILIERKKPADGL